MLKPLFLFLLVLSTGMATASGDKPIDDGTAFSLGKVIDIGFLSLQPGEIDHLDWEIRQRAKRLTPDELPAMESMAKTGSAMHQTILGLVYRDGIEKAVDSATGRVMRYKASNRKAHQWLERAARADYPIAQVELGEMYYSGHGVDRDLVLARYWIKKAARGNYARARLNLLQLDITQAVRPRKQQPYAQYQRSEMPLIDRQQT